MAHVKSRLLEETSLYLGDKDSASNPREDVLESRAQSGTSMPWRRNWGGHHNWRLLVKSGALVASIVLFINVATLAVAYSRFDVENHIANIWTGNCNQAAGIVTAAHLVINVLSSLLLAASNTSMQCLGSPSRAEVDAAHRKQTAFAIGIPSFHNVYRVSRTKMFLWLMLALSSLPLHLFWNSAVFQTIPTNNYYAMSIAEDFIHGATWVDFQNGTISWEINGLYDSIVNMQALAQNSSLERLGRSECIRAYAQELQDARRNVLMITNSSDVSDYAPQDYHSRTSSKTDTSLFAVYAAAFTPNATTASAQDIPTYSWMCLPSAPDDGYGYCELTDLLHLAESDSIPWIPGYNFMGVGGIDACGNFGSGLIACGNQRNAEVLYCLSEQVPGQCKVGLVPVFLVIVCACNVVKIVAFLCTVRLTASRKDLLITQGDAIESFLNTPDLSLQGRCLATTQDFRPEYSGGSIGIWKENSKMGNGRTPGLLKYGAASTRTSAATRTRQRWWEAANGARWTMTYVLFLVFLITAASLFTKLRGDIGYSHPSQQVIWDIFLSQGLGKPLPNFTLGSGNMDIIEAFFLANIPQFVLSYLYMTINILLTSMLGMAEWTSYYAASAAKGLRVSNPGAGSSQTTAHFLTLPFRWALPTLVLFMLLHWLTSQMLFAARIETYSPQGELDAATSVTEVYYSPLVTICVACIGALAIVALFLIALLKRFPEYAPLAGNCSASIAAACQPPSEKGEFEPDLALKKLRWGVVNIPYSDTDVGHATFTASQAGRLLPTRKYA